MPQELAKLDICFNNTESYSTKHPLNSPWVFWYDSGQKGVKGAQAFESGLCEISEFEFIEDFWCVYNKFPTADQVSRSRGRFGTRKKGKFAIVLY